MPENNDTPGTPANPVNPPVVDDTPKPATSPGAGAPNKLTWLEAFLPSIVAAAVLLISAIAALYTPVTTKQVKELTVISSLVPSGENGQWQVQGRVLQDGNATQDASVWALVQYENGQHSSPPSTKTDEHGGFLIASVPHVLGDCALSDSTTTERKAPSDEPHHGTTSSLPVSTTAPSHPNPGDQPGCKNAIDEATIYARWKEPNPPWYRSEKVFNGEDKVKRLSKEVEPVEVVGLSPLKLAPLPAIFLVSAMLPFFGLQTRRKYQVGIVLAFFFTGLMIAYLSLGLRYVTTEGKAKGLDVLELGFASIYKGSYVKDVPAEWVFSFTSKPPKSPDLTAGGTPPANGTTPATVAGVAGAPGVTPAQPAPQAAAPVPGAQTTAPIDGGFGAPLWVLLISVIGAGVLTVALLVAEISKIPAPNQPDQISGHLQGVIEHQLFILFAPVSSIFVYQVMVAGKSASSSFTVALAALGAGPSLSALLTKAAASAASFFGSTQTQPQPQPAEPVPSPSPAGGPVPAPAPDAIVP